MDNEKIKNFIITSRQKGVPDDQILAFVKSKQAPVQTEPTITESVSTDIQQRGQNISDINTMRGQGKSVVGEVLSTVAPKLSERVGGLLKRGQQVKQLVSNPSNDLATTGQLAGGVNDVIGEVIGAIIPEKWKQFGGEKVKQLLGTAGIDTIEKYNDWATQNPLTAKNIEGAVNIAGLLPTGKAGEVVGTAAVDTLKSGGTKLVGAVDNLIIDSKTLADDLITKSQPKVTLEQATGQIIQGKTGDVKQAVQAIGAVDTTGVKTYKDLLGKFKEKKPELLSVVDNELAKDTTQYSLDNLSTTVATNSGKKVSTNYVDSALKDLRELYSTTGDVKQLANLEELAAKGSYTLKEVNDISRVYNSEFGQKAFSKLGDPLTSVNAQRFENTRKGLKDVARRGIGGAEAKKADELLSSVYNTENLVKRNMEAVNKLRQRINERGLFEKAGHYITKYADILTGGTIRGAVAGLLPRGAGYKVLNALDLEEQLAKNLDIINNALTSKSDDIIVNQLKSLDLPIKNSTSKTTPKTGAKTSTSKLNTTNDASLNSSIPTVSKKNGIMSSDLSTGVKKAFNNAKETLKTLKDKNVRERGSISLESILPELKPKGNQGVSLTKNTTEDLVQQAKKYKSAEEFVKAHETTGNVGTSFSRSTIFEKYPDIYQKNRMNIKPNAADKYDFHLSPLTNENFKLSNFENAEGFYKKPKIMKDLDGNTFAYLTKPFEKLGKQEKWNLRKVYDSTSKSEKPVFITEDGGKTFFTAENEVIGTGKTKSQLTDIWNKANKK